jgi:hypothetical protein
MDRCEDTTRDILIRVDTQVQGMRAEMTDRFDKVDKRLERGDSDLREHGKEIVRLDESQKSTSGEMKDHKAGHRRRDGIIMFVVGIMVTVILAVAKYVGGV